jgi:Fic family protein
MDNRRIGRALTDMLLARSDGSPRRSYSMSNQILAERKTYYEVLESTQKGKGEITEWLTSSKWQRITKTSQDTALRDTQDLIAKTTKDLQNAQVF